MGSGCDVWDASVGMEGGSSEELGSSESVGGCFRFRDFSFARRALRSVAAASSDAWEAMIAGFKLRYLERVLSFQLTDETLDVENGL